jgi:hypothetical protein
MKRAFLGIDVGWSLRRPSCGVAWAGVDVPALRRFQREPGIGLANCTLGNLEDRLLTPLLDLHGNGYDQLVIVVDGPVAAVGAPKDDRSIDSRCARGGFIGRAQSFSLASPSGRLFVDATNRILDMVRTRLTPGGVAPWMGGALDHRASAIIAETNPTVAMALLLPQQPLGDARYPIPSRKRAVVIPDHGAVRAKSDYYWYLGARGIAAELLAAPWVSGERHHERVAGLFCLALARALAGDAPAGPDVVAIGNQDGVYLSLARIDRTWQQDVEAVSVHWGKPTWTDTPPVYPAGVTLFAVPVAQRTREQDDRDADLRVEHEGDLSLVLTDNGGLHANVNPWLLHVPESCTVTLSGLSRGVRITRPATPTAPWRVEPTALSLARELNGFDGPHLHRDAGCAIPIESIDSEPGA